MITLPHPHRSYLKAFWIIMTLSSSGVMIGASLALGTWWGCVLGIGLGCISLVYALLEVNMRVMWVTYRAWNKLAELVTSVLQTAIVAISFFIMFVSVGKLGSSLRIDLPTAQQSLWIRRGTVPLHAYESQSGFPTSLKKNAHWAKLFVSWATRSGKYWILFLLPFLYILSFLDTAPSEETAAGIYTLF